MQTLRFISNTGLLILLLLTVPSCGSSLPPSAPLAAGASHTCALTTQGGVQCWGDNGHGEVGDDTTDFRSTPVDVKGLTGSVTAITTGSTWTCVLLAKGEGQCWGSNLDGELGDGTTELSSTPVKVSGLARGVTAIAAGGGQTCALTAKGRVQCWGDNDFGQLGNDTTTASPKPVNVKGLAKGVSAIAAGGEHTCAITSKGGVQCWGRNQYGQLGDGTTANRATPVDVIGLTGSVTAITAGLWHTCAITSEGEVQCWGYNVSGQLGDGTRTDHSTPVDVSGLMSGVTAVAAGRDHTCALTTGGGIQCWGDNDSGQLGDGTTTDRYMPVDVSGLTSGVTAIAAGWNHTCALTAAGGIQCWGENKDRQLGDGTIIDRSVPVDVQH